ncbi:unnamed protein product [Dovyalis caffra]|uniref:Chloroplast envelope membrane protein n=1 Tax=Dovyalis caffra TaxID=77055 RepID=A0AAV1S5N5_9ROSI|nr:unnamed protein product [Dovyalis caffra]
MLDAEAEFSENSSDEELSEEEKFEAWKRRAEAIVELREAQEDMLNEESRRWEDWIVDYGDNGHDDAINGSWWSQEFDGNGGIGNRGSVEDVRLDPTDLVPEKGFAESVRDLVLGREEEDLLYEDRVFRYASLNSAKFLAVLIIIPWALDFAVHDYVLMPFLDRYVKTVPLAAQMLDVRKSQKLEMIKELKVEKARLQLEVEIGKSPPLSDEEEWWELRHKALELRDECRLENRRSFANIWSDIVFGISIFVLLYFNQRNVGLLKFTGYKLINNVSDTGKAFLIILITDIFLGYHSESGWQTLLEVIVEHYGLEVDQSAITIFICLVPVVIDAFVQAPTKIIPEGGNHFAGNAASLAELFRDQKWMVHGKATQQLKPTRRPDSVPLSPLAPPSVKLHQFPQLSVLSRIYGDFGVAGLLRLHVLNIIFFGEMGKGKVYMNDSDTLIFTCLFVGKGV